MILGAIRGKFKTAFETQMPDVTFVAHHPGENSPLKECAWVQSSKSDFDWRHIGPAVSNRTETAQLEIRVRVYREKPRQGDAAEVVYARCEEILEQLEDAIEADFSLDNTFSYGLNRTVSVQLVPEPNGWAALGTYLLEATNHPAT